ncbi:uncharacterized protein VNE69_12092 [Vairimorpha necatrix]|uniref:Uncharacterized protein n=1 Tax=Vairimorpha necatrix TaxID=6039 RepID=A0AAX4JGI4_9MICR
MNILNFFHGIMFVQGSDRRLEDAVNAILKSINNGECVALGTNDEYYSATLNYMMGGDIDIKFNDIRNNGFEYSNIHSKRVSCEKKTIKEIIIEIEEYIRTNPDIDSSKPLILIYNKDELGSYVGSGKTITLGNIIEEIEEFEYRGKKRKIEKKN